MNICPNAYYNFLKHRKSGYYAEKQKVLNQIQNIYHEYGGIDGYRSMKVYLERKGIHRSDLTIHRYMNTEFGLTSIVRREKTGYRKGKPHKVFGNLLKQDFTAEKINQKWCTDFTYLFLTDGSRRYNCSVLDLHDRSILASITDKHITADLAIRTSRDFVEFCESAGITQSMSKAGYPYDNAPMERYYNTLKNELTELHYYHTEEELYSSVEEFAYVTYNHVRPHSYNGYKTPFQARYAPK
jgi:transposase InsO family protein